MVKKKKKAKRQDVMYYRWEFLRRWGKYQNDYKKKKKFPVDYWRKEYEIIDPVDPNTAYGFNSQAYMVPDPAVLVVDCERKSMGYRDTLLETNLEVLLTENKVNMETINTLIVKVNLRQKRERVIEDFKKTLTSWRKACSAVQNKRSRHNLHDLYDIYLQIYDLHRKGYTYRDIAMIVYPNQYTPGNKYDFNRLKEKIKNNLQACKKLIQGGYKIIS